jgi:hypothetical protein
VFNKNGRDSFGRGSAAPTRLRGGFLAQEMLRNTDLKLGKVISEMWGLKMFQLKIKLKVRSLASRSIVLLEKLTVT